MPPKRKKSVRQKQKQSQRQSVVVNIGKTTTRRRKRTGRGGLPPPSHQQNLFPPTIIQQQANLGGLENEISRLTAFIKERHPVNNLVTPLSSSLSAMPGLMAMERQEEEKRRPGPTASNFQSPPSSEKFQPTGDEALAFIQQTLFDEQDRKDFDLKQSQRQPEAEVPFAVVEKEGELLPLSFGTPKPGRPFKNPSSLAIAEPIGAPLADANLTVNLAKGEALDQQGITSFKQQEKGQVVPPPDESRFMDEKKPPIRKKSTKFVPITKEQKKQLILLQKRASLTPGEESVRNQLTELNKKSILFNKELSVTRVEKALSAPGLYDPSKAQGGAVPLSSPFPKPTLSRVETPPGFHDDFFVE